MINLSLTIRNPFSKAKFENIANSTVIIGHHKCFEWEVLHDDSHLLVFRVSTCWNGFDHAGPWLVIGLFGYEICAKIYDVRHWDCDKGEWECQK